MFSAALSSRSGMCQMFSAAISFNAVISKWDVSDVFQWDVVLVWCWCSWGAGAHGYWGSWGAGSRVVLMLVGCWFVCGAGARGVPVLVGCWFECVCVWCWSSWTVGVFVCGVRGC